MSWYWTFAIICGILLALFIVFAMLSSKKDLEFSFYLSALAIVLITSAFITFVGLGIGMPISVKKEMLRYEKERQQIVYQIENLTEDKDKIKLNEWILSYNDWVNDVNTSKETYGWFSKYYGIDMTEHTIIDLV